MNFEPKIDISQTTSVECEECGGTVFEQGLVLRKASGLLTGSDKPSYIPIPVFTCKKCNHINSDFKPKEITSLD